MKKILIVAHSYYPIVCGYANATTNMTIALSLCNKYELHVLTRERLCESPELKFPNLNIHRIPPEAQTIKFPRLHRFMEFLGLDPETRFLKEFFRKHTFEFIIFETFEHADFSLKIIKCGEIPKNKIAIRIHGTTETEIFLYSKNLYHRTKFLYAKKLAKSIVNIIATTPFYIDFFKRYYCDNNIFLHDKNFSILPNFTCHTKTGLNSNDKILLNKLVSNDDHFFLSLGRVNLQGYQQKNFELIAHGMKALQLKDFRIFQRTKIILIISGPMKKEFNSLINELSISDNFVILDQCSNALVQELQRRAMATILVSKYEGHSMFIAEALSNGSPLILSRGTGVSHLVQEGQNGFLINPDLAEELAEAMEKMASTDIEYFRKNSIEIFEKNFTPEILLSKFEILVNILPYTKKKEWRKEQYLEGF